MIYQTSVSFAICEWKDQRTSAMHKPQSTKRVPIVKHENHTLTPPAPFSCSLRALTPSPSLARNAEHFPEVRLLTIIRSVNGQRVSSAEDFSDAVRHIKGDFQILFVNTKTEEERLWERQNAESSFGLSEAQVEELHRHNTPQTSNGDT